MQIFLTLKQTAKFLRFSERHIYRLVNNGDIKARKTGGTYRFHKSDLYSFVFFNLPCYSKLTRPQKEQITIYRESE